MHTKCVSMATATNFTILGSNVCNSEHGGVHSGAVVVLS